MRLALGQIDTIQAEPHHNSAAILDMAQRAAAAGARLLVLPELALPGYSPRDLLYHESFLRRVELETEALVRELPPEVMVVFGSLARPVESHSRRVLNVAVAAFDGRLRLAATKRFLPNYDVFDEARYFETSAQPELVELDGLRIGVTICEDIWNGSDGDPGMPRYQGDPPADVVAAGADLIINLSASPWHCGKGEGREALVVSLARRLERPVLLCNLVGGDDDVVFDGNSLAVNRRGEVIGRASSFTEDLVVFDLDAAPLPERKPDDLEETRRALVRGLGDYFRKSGFERAFLGISGGIDSAVVAALAAAALGADKVTGVAMPSRYSAAESLADARALAGSLGIDLRVLPIEGVFGATLSELQPQFGDLPAGLAEENLQPRIRGLFLMALANKFGGLVLATGNKSELAMGYCTLYGDMCGAFAPIADLLKTEVYELARHLNVLCPGTIPENTIQRPPSAELRPDQKDSDSLPEYDLLDAILRPIIEERAGLAELVASGFPEETVRDVLRRLAVNEYKRKQMPPGLKISRKAFGGGRRMPLTGGRLDRYESPKGRE